jgi:DNA/RNA endonuclease G (NUC1)
MNRNIWRCFERSIREWAANSGDTHVVVGRREVKVLLPRPRARIPIALRSTSLPTHYLALMYQSKPQPMAVGILVPNTEGNLDIRDFMMPVSEREQKSGFKFRLPASVARRQPVPGKWPTRIVKHKLMGRLPTIDAQCPKAPQEP